MSTVESKAAETDDDLVVLVHGTYASSKSDEGDSWWQRGSQAWQDLQHRLPHGVRMPQRGELFHWSGENSERARIKAGRRLLEYLRNLEAEGQSYHLIGHSHGGSVIWHALKLAAAGSVDLEHLRSWATVGTPFMHYRTRGAWNPINLINIAVGLALLKPAFATAQGFIRIFSGMLFGVNEQTSVVTSVPETLSFFRTPVLKTLDLIGLQVAIAPEGIRVGAFDSARGDSLYQFLLFHPQGWLLLIVALLVVFVFLNMGIFFLGPVLESLRIRSEEHLDQNAMRTYRGRWLGLWSTEDEAINGLRTTLNLSISFVSCIEPRQRVLFSDYLTLFSRPYYWILAPLYNRLIRPLLDGMVRGFVIKAAQGNNRPAGHVVDVSTIPVQQQDDRHPSLPDWLDQKIIDAANRCSGDIAPKLRQLMAEPSFAAGLEKFGNAISGRELVHTSYFDHAEVLALLAMHIAWSKKNQQWISFDSTPGQGLAAWVSRFKAASGIKVQMARTPQPDVDPSGSSGPHIIPHRRTSRDAEAA